MRRRDFIKAIASSSVAWPLGARAQQSERPRHIGVLMAFSESDPEAQSWAAGFREELAKLGWADGRNIQVEIRWATADVESLERSAKQLVALQFAMVGDPVGSGFVASLSRPGGNLTGFTPIENSLGGKWVELLKEIAPRVAR